MVKRLGIASLAIIWVAAACASNAAPRPPDGPVLLGESTLVPTTPAPTRILSMTPVPTPTPRPQENLSPLDVATLEADFVLVTPTLPPSKTPTRTPTYTPTPTITPTPTVTITATATMPLFPTSVIIPVTAPVANPVPRVCDSTWFFLVPRPEGCPRTPPIAGQGVYQTFENGYMVWVQAQDAIYVMFSDMQLPRWRVLRDAFDEGMPEDDPAYADSPYPNVWQPRRGFGMLWRDNEDIRDRIGWAVDEWEQPYSVQTQTAEDGTLFISEPTGGVFALIPNGVNWMRYGNFGGFQ